MYYPLFFLFILLNVIDFGSSFFIFKAGFGTEANKVMAYLIQRLGLAWGLFLPKALMVALVGLLTYQVWYALAFLCILYVWVAYNNLHLIYRWKRSLL